MRAVDSAKLPDQKPTKAGRKALPSTEAELAKAARERAFKDAQMSLDLEFSPRRP